MLDGLVAPAVPWTQEYAVAHTAFVGVALGSPSLRRALATGGDLPAGYGLGYDERVVELPWVVANLPTGRLLDAGSSLNHAHVLDRLLPETGPIHVVTLRPEARAFTGRGVSYCYDDLRWLR